MKKISYIAFLAVSPLLAHAAAPVVAAPATTPAIQPIVLQNTPMPNPLAGLYVSAKAGMAEQDPAVATPLMTSAPSGPAFAWGAALGYNFALNSSWTLGFEAGYDDAGTVSETNTLFLPFPVSDTITTKAQVIHGALTVNYVSQNGFNFGIGLGIANVPQTTTSSGSTPDTEESYNYTDPYSSAEMGYLFPVGNNHYANVFFQYSNVLGVQDNATDLNLFQAGLSYYFG